MVANPPPGISIPPEEMRRRAKLAGQEYTEQVTVEAPPLLNPLPSPQLNNIDPMLMQAAAQLRAAMGAQAPVPRQVGAWEAALSGIVSALNPQGFQQYQQGRQQEWQRQMQQFQVQQGVRMQSAAAANQLAAVSETIEQRRQAKVAAINSAINIVNNAEPAMEQATEVVKMLSERSDDASQAHARNIASKISLLQSVVNNLREIGEEAITPETTQQLQQLMGDLDEAVGKGISETGQFERLEMSLGARLQGIKLSAILKAQEMTNLPAKDSKELGSLLVSAKSSQDAIDLIQENAAKLGGIAGLARLLAGVALGKEQKLLRSKIQKAVVKARRDYFGTAVSKTESGSSAGLFPDFANSTLDTVLYGLMAARDIAVEAYEQDVVSYSISRFRVDGFLQLGQQIGLDFGSPFKALDRSDKSPVSDEEDEAEYELPEGHSLTGTYAHRVGG